MELTTKDVLHDLLETTHKNIKAVEKLKKQPYEILTSKKDHESWNALECIEHLNRYGDFYIPEIAKTIKASKHNKSNTFKSNWFGKYFVKSASFNSNLKKMKAFKSMNPLNSKLSLQTLDKFINQQLEIIKLLDKSKEVNLDKNKTSISISKFIKLKLGDTFRVIIYHNVRHIKQAEKIINNTNNSLL